VWLLVVPHVIVGRLQSRKYGYAPVVYTVVNVVKVILQTDNSSRNLHRLTVNQKTVRLSHRVTEKIDRNYLLEKPKPLQKIDTWSHLADTEELDQ